MARRLGQADQRADRDAECGLVGGAGQERVRQPDDVESVQRG